MRKITKGLEPAELTQWKRKYPNSRYVDLETKPNDTGTNRTKKFEVRQAIRKTAIGEQYGLCAYCCNKIDESNSINEHVEAQHLAPNRTLDFNNIVASCTTKGRCDNEHGSQPLPLTPLMDECETELRFKISGVVDGLSDRAKETIRVLGLNSKAIKEERKRMVDALIVPDDFNGLQLVEDELLSDLLADFQKPNNGQLLPYSPVLVNILKQLLTTP